MALLRTIVISPDAKLTAQLESALTGLGDAVEVCRTVPGYPSVLELERIVRATAPDAVFLNFEHLEKARAVVKSLEVEAPGLPVIAVHRTGDPAVMRETMRAGIRELVVEPFDRSSLGEALANVSDLIEKRPPLYSSAEQIVSFLPSKAGVGASTLAVNVSGALARLPDTKVLLSDFDLGTGMLRFLLKLHNNYSVADAAENATRMDENLWPQMVTSVGGMDVLHAGGLNPNMRISTEQIRALIQFMRRNYKILCFDLSGNLERYSTEIMRESKRVLLICTPELASLHQAKEKLLFLKSLDLDGRVSVLLNRVHHKAPLSADKVEEVLGVPVLFSFANDYQGVMKATQSGQCVDLDRPLGRQVVDFARNLVGLDSAPVPVSRKHKFLELFNLPSNLTAPSEK